MFFSLFKFSFHTKREKVGGETPFTARLEACTTQKTAKNATEFTLHSTYTSTSISGIFSVASPPPPPPHCVLRKHLNGGSHSSFMVWKSKRMSVCAPYQTNMRTCMNDSQRARQGYLRLSTLKTANTVRLSSRLQLVLTILALFDMFLIMVSNFSINGSGS